MEAFCAAAGATITSGTGAFIGGGARTGCDAGGAAAMTIGASARAEAMVTGEGAAAMDILNGAGTYARSAMQWTGERSPFRGH